MSNYEVVSELRDSQKKLCDDFVIHPEKVKKIMDNYMNKINNFHNYSLNNLLIADYQLYMRNGKNIELLAPYKRWGKINRNVKKGEKALYILAPIFWEEEENGKTIKHKWFKRVPVFDISQTEGEPFEDEYFDYKYDISFDEIVSRTEIPVIMTDKELTLGSTNGKEIKITEKSSDIKKIIDFFHELAHYKLHFGEDREELSREIRELEAESVSYMVSLAIGIENHEASAYIKNWAGENSPELIKGRGSRLIQTAQQIIEDMNLKELIDTKKKISKFNALKEMVALNFACFDECLELKELDEELFESACNENWNSNEAWDYFEKGLLESI